MKTGKYILGCSFLLAAVITPVCLTTLSLNGIRIPMPLNALIIPLQLTMVVLGWGFVIDSDPKESKWEFEKWLARKFYKID